LKPFAGLILGIILVLGTSLPAYAEAPVEVRISNITNASFSVSWMSNSPEAGYVLCGTDPTNLTIKADDDRGAGVTSTTHHVTLTDLQESTRYYCDIHSGATVDDNGGAHYQIVTGPIINIAPPGAIYGQASRADGSSPAGIMVYLMVRDGDGKGSPGRSALLSTIIKEKDQGYWYLNLGNARVEGLTAPFAYSASGDKLELRFVGGPGQVAEITLDTGAAAPAPTVAVPTAGALPQVTATPTGQPTLSPTPSPTRTPGSTATLTMTPTGTPTPSSTPTAGATNTPTVIPTALPPATAGIQTPAPPSARPTDTPSVGPSPAAMAQTTASPVRPTPTLQPPAPRTVAPAATAGAMPVGQPGGGVEEWVGWVLIILGGSLLVALGMTWQRGRRG